MKRITSFGTPGISGRLNLPPGGGATTMKIVELNNQIRSKHRSSTRAM